MSDWGTYDEPELVKGDEYRAQDHYGAVIAVKVKQHKEGIVTPNTPEPGGPGVIVDLVDLGTEKVYRDVLFMGGAMVDGLKRYVGGKLVVSIEPRKSKSGRTYPAPVGVDSGPAKAQAYVTKHGDPFTDQWATPAAPADDKPPF